MSEKDCRLLESSGFIIMDGCALHVHERLIGDIVETEPMFHFDGYEQNPNDGRLFDALAGEFSSKKITVRATKDGCREILADGNVIVKVKGREVIALNLLQTEYIGPDFLKDNRSLRVMKAPSLQKVGDYFLQHNNTLEVFEAQYLRTVGMGFLAGNNVMTQLSLPKLKTAHHYFLYSNNVLKKLDLPDLKRAGNYFLRSNNSLEMLNLPSLEEVWDYFMAENTSLEMLDAPKLVAAGNDFLKSNRKVKTNAPIAETIFRK